MKRTRKWAFVAQEATRLCALGLSPLEIAKRLGVDKSSVTRWIASGKLKVVALPPPGVVQTRQTPAEWAAEVRRNYDLDATDDQLVTIAETALGLSFDQRVAAHVRMTAAGRFQAIVRQLALVARKADQPAAEPNAETRPAAPKLRPVNQIAKRRDPRTLLMAVR